MEGNNHNQTVPNGHNPTHLQNGHLQKNEEHTPFKEQNGRTPVDSGTTPLLENGNTPHLEKDPEKYDLGKENGLILTNNIDINVKVSYFLKSHVSHTLVSLYLIVKIWKVS